MSIPVEMVFQAKVPLSSAGGQSIRMHSMPFGAEIGDEGEVRFRLWAPAARRVAVEVAGGEKLIPLSRNPDGWHEAVSAEVKAGSRYSFLLPDGQRVPDPASRFQPEDVHGPSEIIDPKSYLWNDSQWVNRPWAEAVIYELHVGTFTHEGTFSSAMQKLDHLASLGVTAVEIMPVADFLGKRNWGYDGVLLYAPDSSYGRPEDFKAFVDHAHARGLMVILDVVYNHFGPDGNYLPLYAPQTFTDHHKTAWGDAVNFDDKGSEVIREFVIHNAMYWIEEFHVDGLRLDAVHAIKDDSRKHLLREMAERVRVLALPNHIHLILENEENQAHRLRRDKYAEPLEYTAQWNDDVHHVLHTAATHESNGYYEDFLGDTEKLGRALAEGFAFQGEVMPYSGQHRGEPSGQLPPAAFVAFIQNHDQVGNRALGERVHALAPPEAVHAIAAVYLLLPQTPMLFMGEEWGSTQPFPFFCDFGRELGELVHKGRKEEFSTFPQFHDPEQRALIPDPQSEETFRSAKLNWEQAESGCHAEWLDWYREILNVRRRAIVPVVELIEGNAGNYKVLGPGAVSVSWKVGSCNILTLEANLSDSSIEHRSSNTGETIWQEGPVPHENVLKPWSVRWSFAK